MIDRLPTVTFSTEADHDTVFSVLDDWYCKVTTTGGNVAEGVIHWDGRTVELHDEHEGRVTLTTTPERVTTIEVQ